MALTGRIEKTDIPTLLRSVEKDKNSGELSFNRNGERVDLYFLFGQLYHGKWGDVVGLDAVTEVLTWKNGNYAFTEGVIPAQPSIDDDLEKILSSQPPTPVGATITNTGRERRQTGSLGVKGNAITAPLTNPPVPASYGSYNGGNNAPSDGGGDMSDLIPFDLASLDSMNAVFPTEQVTPNPNQAANLRSVSQSELDTLGMTEDASNSRIAPSPPANGLYRTRLFCLPTGEQMATSLVATGPQLEEELLHLAEVKFTGYVLGGPDINGFATVGICLLRGRFVHAFYHVAGPSGMGLVEGERAYRTVLDQRGSQAARFYWFYELTAETMRAAIALLTPPTRYSHLEVRILRFKELLRLLNEESYTGTLRITIPSGALGPDRQPSTLAGERAYIPIFQGAILGLWSEHHPRLTNDGQLLQRFLNEPQAFLDLHATAPVADPGLPLESLISSGGNSVALEMSDETSGGAAVASYAPVHSPNRITSGQSTYSEPAIPQAAQPIIKGEVIDPVDDDERQLRLITSIGRMESTWTQMQKKGKIDAQMLLFALAGFGNEVLSMTEGVNGRRGVQEMVQRSLRQELAQYRTIFQLLDVSQGRVSISKLLREYELFSRDGEQSAGDFSREAGRGLRTLLRSAFQHYVSLIRSENTRLESQDMYEVFLQDVVKKM